MAGETSVPQTGGANPVDSIFNPMKNIDRILSSKQIFVNSIEAKNNFLLFPLRYLSGNGISRKFNTAYAHASLTLQLSE